MKNTVNYVILILVLVCLISCSTSPAHSFKKIHVDGKGEVCSNAGGPKLLKPLYSIHEDLSLGGEEPNPKLFQPSSIMVDDQGCMYFTDEGRIKKFSSEGEFLSLISRPGQGPGEISHPKLTAIKGDTLYADQYMWSGGRKFELFHISGSHIEQIRHPTLKVENSQGRRKYTIDAIDPNRLLFFTQDPHNTAGKMLYKWNYGIADKEGNVVKMLDLDLEPFSSWVERDGHGTAAPFLVGAKVRIANDIYVLSGAGSRIDVFFKNGIRKRTIELNLEPEKITSQEIDSFIKSKERPGYPYTSILKPSDFPKFKPIACDMIIDDKDQLWIKKGQDIYTDFDKPISYMLFSREGEYMADQEFPCLILVIKNNIAYGFIKTDDDVLIFKRFKLKI